MKISLSFEITNPFKNQEVRVVERGITKTEFAFPIEKWRKLKAGDTIVSRRSGLVRKITRGCGASNCIELDDGPTYCSGDRLYFIPVEDK